ncbi:lysoplasmalogenase, partial [candidate division KSB1 bacterium]|nr:lysoplasmalogenase [candidate division KSB1 bacterium]NIR71797.1 lysoplasmalogenase [candidate division KSB1 bacterium]NIS25779.1 lysoplasmalogenase [candidate division KSB1 bacterium]NIT72649.1 lysoplasmalogenase [candidate division KSB1 bacterium]NIU26469.1 lysoplasmalogenase [candidate division KSB1 bacterium]
MLIKVLTFLTAACAYFYIRAENRGSQIGVYLSKPLTVLSIIAIALLIDNPISSFYKYLIILGLVFSLFGDIFLMLPSDHFLAGLLIFLITHLFYSAAFAFTSEFHYTWYSLVGFVVLYATGRILFAILKPHLGNFRLLVLVYMIVILTMSWLAFNRWLSTEHHASLLAFAGALFF